MRSMPNIFRFILIFMACYLTLSALTYVKPVRAAIVPVYNVFQQGVSNSFHTTIRTGFRKYAGHSEEYDYSIYIYSDEEYRRSRNKNAVQPYVISNQSARLTALGPFIMLIALIIASPIGWRRKLLSFVIGSLFVLILLGMKYTALFDANMEVLKSLGSWWIGISKLFNDAFRTNEFLALIIIPIWAISSFRMKDWKWFIE